ncbi:MAG: DoxX family protein [Beutenbergiaceae bacterium]
MQIALWIVNGLLAALFLFAGSNKAVRTPKALIDMGMAWVSDAPPWAPRVIGTAEVVGALGLILPMATGIAPLLTPIAAVALALVMVGATVVHLRRDESPATTIVLAVTSAASAVLGFAVL